MPAHFCGVFGHKPTFGLVPLRGYSLPPAPPVPGSGDLGVAGPMTRHASDLGLALDVIAGPDEVREAARGVLSPSGLVVTVLGDADALEGPLSAVTEVTRVEVA